MSRRVTSHNGRKGKNGVYNPKHNDRNFTTESDHIDETKSAKNYYWTCIKDAKNFEACESEFYEKHFSAGLQKLNSKHSRHKDRMKTMDEYRVSVRTCPEETLYYIGDRNQPIDERLFRKILIEQINWELKKFPNVRPLDVAIHRDEPGADHLHFRKVWIAHDDEGNEIVNQTLALQEMGIERPDTDKEQNRYNNPKQTYTKLVRQHFVELCRSYGIEIEDKPKDKSKSGLSLDAYKAEQMKEEARQEAEAIKSEAKSEAKRVVTDAQGQADRIRQEAEAEKAKLLAGVTERERAVSQREGAVTAKERKQQEQADAFQQWEDALDAQQKALEENKANFGREVRREATKMFSEWKEQEEQQKQAKPGRALPFGGSFDY